MTATASAVSFSREELLELLVNLDATCFYLDKIVPPDDQGLEVISPARIIGEIRESLCERLGMDMSTGSFPDGDHIDVYGEMAYDRALDWQRDDHTKIVAALARKIFAHLDLSEPCRDAR